MQRNWSMFQFLTHVELSRSMAAILEMPQYLAYQKNVVYAFIKLSAKSHSFNILCTMDGLSCPTICKLLQSLINSAQSQRTPKILSGVARLSTPGGQESNISSIFPHSPRFSLNFPQFFFIFFLNLRLRVGGPPTREGPGYATENTSFCKKVM